MIKIKRYIEYYYNFNDINVIKIDSYYKFEYSNDEYLFMPLTRQPIEIIQIYKIINGKKIYDNIILNIKNEIITNINGRYFILIRKANKTYALYDMICNSNMVFLNESNIDRIIKTNWCELWSKKIDYIEYRIINTDNINSIVNQSIWYYVGMAENAISYINDTILMNKQQHNLYISHKRIIPNFFNNPLNLVVDYKSRDIAEYLKYIFIEEKYDYIDISKKLNSLNLDEFLCRLIYGRMFFDTFYFDFVDVVLNNISSDMHNLKKLINRVNEYEDYINNIYLILNKIKKIPKIDWL